MGKIFTHLIYKESNFITHILLVEGYFYGVGNDLSIIYLVDQVK